MCYYLKKSLKEIYELSEIERTWLLYNIYRKEKEKYDMIKLIIKVLRPELDLERNEDRIFETDEETLREDLKNSFPNLSQDEIEKLVQDLKKGLTPIDVEG